MSEISPTNFLLVSFPLYNKLKIQVFEKFAKEGKVAEWFKGLDKETCREKHKGFKAKSTPKTEDL